MKGAAYGYGAPYRLGRAPSRPPAPRIWKSGNFFFTRDARGAQYYFGRDRQWHAVARSMPRPPSFISPPPALAPPLPSTAHQVASITDAIGAQGVSAALGVPAPLVRDAMNAVGSIPIVGSFIANPLGAQINMVADAASAVGSFIGGLFGGGPDTPGLPSRVSVPHTFME